MSLERWFVPPTTGLAKSGYGGTLDWLVSFWCPPNSPDHAAAEIRRLGENPRFVGVALGANGLGKPFGHPVYHPIYEAAHIHGLPIVLQAGSEGLADSINFSIAGGAPASYGEYHAHCGAPLMAYIVGLIAQGVFDLFPSLRFLLVGGGAAWIPAFLWRMDGFGYMGRSEMPWLSALPSEYLVLETLEIALVDVAILRVP
jgi:uncharacterized protein